MTIAISCMMCSMLIRTTVMVVIIDKKFEETQTQQKEYTMRLKSENPHHKVIKI